jgi:CheY-like chemotaxis protein
MNDEQVKRLFQPFTQADGSISRRFGGTGLGLAICQRLVKKMNGTITIDSELNYGTCFSVSLPLQLPKFIDTKLRLSTKLRQMRVLVVDDVETSRCVLKDILLSWGLTVTEADSGMAALEMLIYAATTQQAPYELILLDWKMPNMNGITVAQRIHELATNKILPKLPTIVMVTAYNQESMLEEISSIKLHGVLHKPIMASVLLETLLQLEEDRQISVQVTDSKLSSCEQLPSFCQSRVLLVEDNEINQMVIQDLLEQMDISVTVANNGQHALQCVQQEQFDLILMDLQMPVMDGLEATRQIRALNSMANNIPIIAVTAAALPQDRVAVQIAGMNGYISKPVVYSELLNVLQKWIKLENHATSLSKWHSADNLNLIATKECSNCDCGLINNLLNTLRELIDNYEFVPGELITDLLKSIGCQPMRLKMELIAHRIEKTDYDGARQILNNMSCKHKLGSCK